MTEATAPQATPHTPAWLAAWQQLRFTTQLLCCGTAVALAWGVGLHLAALPPSPWWAPLAGAAGAVLATVANTWCGAGHARALGQIKAKALRLRRPDALGDENFEIQPLSADMQAATAALRRLAQAHRRRMLVLQQAHAALGKRLDMRTHELSTLQGLSINLANASEMHELVDETLSALEQSLEYTTASIWSRTGGAAASQAVLLGYRDAQLGELPEDELKGARLSRQHMAQYERIEQAREPVVENDVRQSLFSWLWSKLTDDAQSSGLYRSTRAWAAVPLAYQESVLGVLRVDHQEPNRFAPEQVRLLNAIGSQAALAMHHAELMTQQREMAVAAERNRIARDLHDAVSQTLFAANMLSGNLRTLAERAQPQALPRVADMAHTLQGLTQGALAELRMLMFEMRPEALETAKLADLFKHQLAAIRARGDIAVEETLTSEDLLVPALRIQVYRIAQEALSNVVRHSGAKRVHLAWGMADAEHAELRIQDDGHGFDPSMGRPGGFGLDNMRTRAEEMGATLTMTSSPGQGSVITLTLPIAASATLN